MSPDRRQRLDIVDRRTTSARCLQEMGAEVIASGQPLWYGDAEAEPADDISESQRMYVANSKVHEFAILPLRRPAEDDRAARRNRPLGVLIVEPIHAERRGRWRVTGLPV